MHKDKFKIRITVGLSYIRNGDQGTGKIGGDLGEQPGKVTLYRDSLVSAVPISAVFNLVQFTNSTKQR